MWGEDFRTDCVFYGFLNHNIVLRKNVVVGQCSEFSLSENWTEIKIQQSCTKNVRSRCATTRLCTCDVIGVKLWTASQVWPTEQLYLTCEANRKSLLEISGVNTSHALLILWIPEYSAGSLADYWSNSRPDYAKALPLMVAIIMR